MDRIFDIAKLPVFAPEPLTGKVSKLFQFPQRGTDGIYAVPADIREALRRIVPALR